MGSPDIRQINGMGGGTSVTSKVYIISKSLEDNVDIDYLFAQVEVDREYVDFEPTCGNMLSAIGPFSIEEGLVRACREQTNVTVRSINTGSLTNLVVPTPKGKVIYSENFRIDGVPSKGSQFVQNSENSKEKKTGSLFPTNEFTDLIDNVHTTCIDLVNPIVLALAKDFSIEGNETFTPIQLNKNTKLLSKIEKIRKLAAFRDRMGDVGGKCTQICLTIKEY